MKKYLLPPLTCFGVTLLWLFFHIPVGEVTDFHQHEESEQKAKPLPLPLAEVAAMREPSAEVKPKSHIVNFERPQTKVSHEETREFRGLPTDLKLATHLYSINAEDYAPNMGDIVANDEKTVTFRADVRPTNAQFMAIDVANDRFFPISPTVKLNNVSEEVRSALLNEGLIETYYNEDLKVMFVESVAQNVLEVYEKLTGLNLDAEIEVIRGFHRPR